MQREKTVETWDRHKNHTTRILVATGGSTFVPGSFTQALRAFCMGTVGDAVRLHDTHLRPGIIKTQWW